MFESSENTIIKAKYFRLNKEQPYQSKQQLVPDPEDYQECFTSQFRGPQKIADTQPLRKTDKMEKFAKMYEQYFKSTSTATKYPNENDSKNPQNSLNETNSFIKSESTQIYSTPQKYQQFFGVDEKDGTNSNQKTTSKEFLFINSPLQSYSTPLDFDNPELGLPNNAQILKYHIEKAKGQTQKLKDEQLKLKLEKVKIAAKKSQNETMKLIPLKIEHQRLKKQIEKLIQEKEILQMNNKIKETSKSSDIKINGMEFKVIKHIPGTIYSQHQLDYQKEDSIEYSRVVKKTSNNSFIQNSPLFSSYSNASLPSYQNLSQGNKTQGESFQVGTTVHFPTYFAGKKYPSNNDQPTRSMNNIPNQPVKPLTGESLVHTQMQKMKQNELNRSQEKTSKSAFLTFAKASLKNGNSLPTFCKTPSSEIMQNLNSSIQGITEGNKSTISNGSNQVVTNYVNRPVTSTSHSPRNQAQYQ